MSFILDVDTTDVKEFHTLPTGTEAEVRIVKVTQKNSKSSQEPMLEIQMDIPDDQLSKDIYYYLMLPTNTDSEKRKAQKLLNLKELKAAFDLPATGPISTEDMEGRRAWAILKEEEGDGENKSRNSVSKFVTGR